ncbi:hypothetical protein ITP53_25705 [Nonomuraea sp. K274]|uniref:Uncharacterized protein n=1 Tax=Nonomuraea cypriaca TaxID=1187855 RepID=A0A931ADG7_9ACTN|nr:hypothetical protein [Nonomuraea cypriaca]MBF8189069.1 hypothetical protein [Nonomuraea cypriaca]
MTKSRAELPGWGSGQRRDGQAPSTPRRRMSKKLGLVILGVLVIAALPYLSQALFSPWALSLTGRPTLPGYWHGEMSFGRGDTRPVVMHLRATTCSRCSDDIEGEATVCVAGRSIDYRLSGEAADRNAGRFTLDSWPYPDTRAPGTHLGHLEATWAGGDEISITATLHVTNPDGSWSSNKQPAEPSRFRLHRDTETNFRTAC